VQTTKDTITKKKIKNAQNLYSGLTKSSIIL